MRTIRTPQKRGKFLAQLERHGNVVQSCKASGVSHRAAYEWRADDQDFKRDWELALEAYAAVLEAEADRRAVEGYTGRILVDENGTIHEQKHFSDNLLMFRLKGLKPKMYKDRVEHSGDQDSPILIKDATQRQARIRELEAKLNGHEVEV